MLLQYKYECEQMFFIMWSAVRVDRGLKCRNEPVRI